MAFSLIVSVWHLSTIWIIYCKKKDQKRIEGNIIFHAFILFFLVALTVKNLKNMLQ